MDVLNKGMLLKVGMDGSSSSTTPPTICPPSWHLWKKFQSDDEVTEEVKYNIQIGIRKKTDALVSRWDKVTEVDGDLEENWGPSYIHKVIQRVCSKNYTIIY